MPTPRSNLAKAAAQPALRAQKIVLRQSLKVRRASIGPDLRDTTRWKSLNLLRGLITQNRSDSIGLYYPRGGEIDILPLVRELWQQGKTVALPRVVYPGFPMVYNIWEAGAPLERDALGLPCAGGAEIVPLFIGLPMLGYSKKGHRLGSGGGYYDITLKSLQLPVITAGVCHTELEIPQFPAEYTDVRLDYVVTGKEVITCI